jgi:hypothetical protein
MAENIFVFFSGISPTRQDSRSHLKLSSIGYGQACPHRFAAAAI